MSKCIHCGGSGQLVKVDPKKPYIVNWANRTKAPNAVSKPFMCNFCGGTGEEKNPTQRRVT